MYYRIRISLSKSSCDEYILIQTFQLLLTSIFRWNLIWKSLSMMRSFETRGEELFTGMRIVSQLPLYKKL